MNKKLWTYFDASDVNSRAHKLLKQQNGSAVSTGDGVAVLDLLAICLTVL